MLKFEILVSQDGLVVARTDAESDQLRLPDGWLAKERDERDDDLTWWFEEAANVWFQGIHEQHPPPPPAKQEELF